jgi:hypothetical protein
VDDASKIENKRRDYSLIGLTSGANNVTQLCQLPPLPLASSPPVPIPPRHSSNALPANISKYSITLCLSNISHTYLPLQLFSSTPPFSLTKMREEGDHSVRMENSGETATISPVRRQMAVGVPVKGKRVCWR